MFKIVDRLLLKSFVGPFIVTFAIAIFFFLMQTLWFYIDDLVGKGLGLFFIIELLAYKCVSLIPMALPLAILISCVMVMGGMAEHYELSTMKSAGVRLLRVMRPLILIGLASGVLSYYCSANLIPLANLKFGSRMYDIQQQQPVLRMDEGVFNDDFPGFSIHIGEKGNDGRSIEDVLIYDQSEHAKGGYSQISAEKGEMFMAQEGRFFVMNLKNGYQYIEVVPGGAGSNSGKYPFVRTSFKQWTKVFDMTVFTLNRTNEDLFTNNKSMMSIPQLEVAVDSMALRIDDRRKAMWDPIRSFFTFFPADSTFSYQPTENTLSGDSVQQVQLTVPKPDTARPDTLPDRAYQPAPREGTVAPPTGETLQANSSPIAEKLLHHSSPYQGMAVQPVLQVPTDSINPLDTATQFAHIFDQPNRLRLYDRAKTSILSIQNQAESAVRSLQAMREQQVKYSYELWTKYSIAVVCIIFVFIGAPMGAIVRKGGFGYPILISIIFFMLFVILTIFCRKIAEAFVLPAPAAAWVPAAVLFPIGLMLTVLAMNDSSLNLVEWLTRLTERLKRLKRVSV
jgi:lipopolysaccharide export system permease protein